MAKSDQRAVHWYRLAAAQGLTSVVSNLAYLWGRGVELGDGRDETRKPVS